MNDRHAVLIGAWISPAADLLRARWLGVSSDAQPHDRMLDQSPEGVTTYLSPEAGGVEQMQPQRVLPEGG